MEFKPVKVAIIGSGMINYIYSKTLKLGGFSIVDYVGCSDLIPEKSKARSELFGVRQMTTEEILSDPEIEIVLDCTQIWNHNAVNKMILDAGKHVYSEKSFGHTLEGAKANYELAKSKGLRIGSAPDCYMGAAYQTARKLIDDGMIGVPLFAQAFCFRAYAGYESETDVSGHIGGTEGCTITYDMGPYYINALVSLFGSVNRVSGYNRYFDSHVYTNPRHPKYKQPVDKQTGQTLMMGCLEFESGLYASMTMCSNGFGDEIPRVEVYGTEGTLNIPDPDHFGGNNDRHILLTRTGNRETYVMPITHGFADLDANLPTLTGKYEACYYSHRGVAVVDMAWAIRRNRLHRSNGELALHAVEIIDAIGKSHLDNKVYTMETRPGRPAPLTPGCFGKSAEFSIDNIAGE